MRSARAVVGGYRVATAPAAELRAVPLRREGVRVHPGADHGPREAARVPGVDRALEEGRSRRGLGEDHGSQAAGRALEEGATQGGGRGLGEVATQGGDHAHTRMEVDDQGGRNLDKRWTD